MEKRRYSPCNLGRSMIGLGKQGEGNALQIVFDCSAWLTEYPDAVIVLNYFEANRPNAQPIKPTLSEEGMNRVWLVTEDHTKHSGIGVVELELQDADTGAKIKSATGRTTVISSPSSMIAGEGEGDTGGDTGGSPGGTGGGFQYKIGPGLKVMNGDTLAVDTATVVMKDNTKPVTSGAVYKEVGNINALLATI